jgi:glycosyltransferase involved in cell wall biosynthesis
VLIPPGDVDALAAGIRHLLSDDGARAAMGQRARTYVCERFSIDRLVHNVDALYRELLATNGASNPAR